MALLKIQNQKPKGAIRWLVEVLILAVLLWLFFILAGRALCHIALSQIAEMTNTKIKTESVNFRTNGSVLIKELIISPHEMKSDDETILKAETVYARFSLRSLFLLRPRLKDIDVDDFIFNAQYDLDTGSWNLSALTIKPPKGTSGKMPRIHLKAGTLQYSKISNGQVKVAVSVPINARFGFDEETQKGYSFDITTATMASGYGQSRLTGFWKPGSVTIAGGISSVDVPELEMAWIIDVLAAELKYDKDNTYSMKLRIKDLQSKRSPALDKLVLVGPAFLERSSPFAALQKFFSQYQPYGRIDIDLEALGNFNRISESTLSGKVYCKDVAFCYYKFPYAVEHLAGRIDLTKNSAVLNNLKGKHGDVELFFNGWSRDFGPDRKHQIRIKSDNFALDDDLYRVLDTKQKESWSAFSPTGFAAIDYRFNRHSQVDKEKKLTVDLRGADAQYRRFPYPLKNLTGRLLFEQGNVIFSDVVSQVNECKITLNGKVATDSDNNSEYNISVDVNNVPLDSTLEQSLPEVQRNLYSRIRPGGLADGRIKISGRNSEPAAFTADLFFKKASLESDRLSSPVSDISANAVFTPDLITVKNFSGRYGDGLVSLTGRIWPDRESQQSLNAFSSAVLRLSANNILLDECLAASLPQHIQPLYNGLLPVGRFDLDFNNIRVLPKENGQKSVDFTGDIGFKNCSFKLSGAETELNAVLKIKGLYNTRDGLSNCQAAFDGGTLRIQGKSFTNLRTDIFYDSDRRCWSTEDLIADCYGGKSIGKFELRQPAEQASEYLLQVVFDKVDLQQFLSDTKDEEGTENGYTSGRMDGSLNINAHIGDSSSRIGTCKLVISDMQVGRLSPLGKLLQVLKLTEPKDFAFDQMFVDSYIRRDEMLVKKLDLSGRAIAFYGSGSMDLKTRNIDLELTARGRRLATDDPSVLQSLTEGLGRAVIKMEVTGDFYDPYVQTTALPVIRDTLKILGTKPDIR